MIMVPSSGWSAFWAAVRRQAAECLAEGDYPAATWWEAMIRRYWTPEPTARGFGLGTVWEDDAGGWTWEPPPDDVAEGL